MIRGEGREMRGCERREEEMDGIKDVVTLTENPVRSTEDSF